MRYDLSISLTLSVDVYDEQEARELAERIASRIEVESEWVCSSALCHPDPLAVVEDVWAVPDAPRG